MLNYIKCGVARLQAITTGFTSNTKQQLYINEQICVEIVKIKK